MEDRRITFIDPMVIMPNIDGIDLVESDMDYNYFISAIQSGLDELKNKKCRPSEFYEVIKHICNSISTDLGIEEKDEKQNIESIIYESSDAAYDDFVTTVSVVLNSVIKKEFNQKEIDYKVFYEKLYNACVKLETYFEKKKEKGIQFIR